MAERSIAPDCKSGGLVPTEVRILPPPHGMNDDRLFYVGQKAFIEKDGKILVLNDPAEGLDFPGGKIQVGEINFTEALKREVGEETNLEIEVGNPFTTWYNKFPEGGTP